MKKIILSSVVASLVLIGCSGGGSSAPVEKSVGHYVDSAVEGVEYNCGVFNGKTDSAGTFEYEKGKKCEFKLGELLLREVNQTILSNENVTVLEDNPRVAQLLQTLDFDGNTTNGIKIADELKDEINNALTDNQFFDKMPDESKHDVKSLIKNIHDQIKAAKDDYKGKFVDIDDVKKHLEDTFEDVKNQLGEQNGGTHNGGLEELRRRFDEIRHSDHNQSSPHSGYEHSNNEESSTTEPSRPHEDTLAPRINLVGEFSLTLPFGSAYVEQGAIAEDNRDGDITNSIEIIGSVDTSVAGRHEIKYRVSDAAGNTTVAVRTVYVQRDTNRAPTAKNDQVILRQGSQAEFTLFGSDPEGDDITYIITRNPEHGTISAEGATLVYTPDSDFIGTDHLYYKVYDGKVYSYEKAVNLVVNY